MQNSRVDDDADDELKNSTYVVVNRFHQALLVAKVRQLIVHRTNQEVDAHMTPIVKFGVELMLKHLLSTPQGADGTTLLRALPSQIRGHRVTIPERIHILKTAVAVISQTATTATKIKEELVRT